MPERKNTHIYLASPHMSQEGYEQQYIREAFDSNWIAPLGENVNQFEKEMIEELKAGTAVALSSGTAAIHMSLKAAGIKEGDLVFCQSLTFAATANPILYEKAVPIFIDSDKKTWNMSPEALEKAFRIYEELGKKPKAVIVVHLYGLCAAIERIAQICRKHKVVLIEDAAESLGSTYEMESGEIKYMGTVGDYGILSFNGNKIITTSGGGMLLINTSDAEEKAKKVLFWATQAREDARWYQHKETGYNYRMSNVLAGIGRGQLKVLKERIQKKKFIFAYYKEHLEDLEEITIMPFDKRVESNCWLSVILLKKEAFCRPLDLILSLEREEIESRPVWKPLHLQPVYRGMDFVSVKDERITVDLETGADDSVAGELFAQGVCLPSDTKMTEEDLKRICEIVRKCVIAKRSC